MSEDDTVTTDSAAGPQMRVVQHFPGAPVPKPADSTLDGSIPLRAARFCSPVLVANGHGLNVYPPADMVLYWDGHEVLWRLEDADDDEWELLSHPVQFPGHDELWAAKSGVDYAAPSFLSAVEPGLIHFWPGLTATTNPGWAVLLRGAVNRTRSAGIEVLEGIIETSWFRGPLAGVIRLTSTDRPIVLSKSVPLFSIWPIATAALDAADYTIEAEPEQSDFDSLVESLEHRIQRGKPGEYRRRARRGGATGDD